MDKNPWPIQYDLKLLEISELYHENQGLLRDIEEIRN